MKNSLIICKIRLSYDSFFKSNGLCKQISQEYSSTVYIIYPFRILTAFHYISLTSGKECPHVVRRRAEKRASGFLSIIPRFTIFNNDL